MLLFASLAASASCGASPRDAGPARASSATRARVALRDGSNVAFQDYVGSAACASCHADIAQRFAASPMHNMTRMSASAKSFAPWSGEGVTLGDDTATLTANGGERFVTIHGKNDEARAPRVYRVTRIIGGRKREDYAGVRVAEAVVGAPVIEREELVLPVSWIIGARRVRYKGYSVMVTERPRIEAGPVWRETCIFCHNTVPYTSTVLGALARSEAKTSKRRAFSFQGEVVDDLLPPDRRATYRVTNAAAWSEEVAREMARLPHSEKAEVHAESTAPVTPAMRALSATRSRFDATALVEVGIGCESCHNGARAHAAHPKSAPSLAPVSNAFEVSLPTGENAHAASVNRVCARCHQVLFSHYPYTWEGGERVSNAPGGSNINSGEARDFLLGACRTQLACTGCHDPHGPSSESLRAESHDASNARCTTTCHEGYRDAAKLRAHSHHDAAGEGSLCMSCHMPRKNMSLDGTLTRYHRIGSPTAQNKVLLDRPLECALCHADYSVEKIVTTMNTWWKTTYAPSEVARLYGGPEATGANVLLATAKLGKPHEQAVAYSVLGDKHVRAALPMLEQAASSHSYPLVREWAAAALAKVR